MSATLARNQNMKPIFQAGRGYVRGVVVGRSLILAAWVLPVLGLPAVVRAETFRDPLEEARAVLAQRRDEADQRRNAENPGAWSRFTNRSSSPYQRSRMDEERDAQAAKAAQGPSPFNPKFGAPTFQMPTLAAQDASAPQLKQFHPTEDPNAPKKGGGFLARDRGDQEDLCPEDRERREAEAAAGKKSTLSYTGEDPAKQKHRSYDEIYQSKSPYALPTFQMPAGPAAALAAPGAQTWGGRVLTQYRPEMDAKGLEKARMQRDLRSEEREVRREENSGGLMNVFDRTKRLESR